uniref:NB-ARC domain-containing protein n=1 Tax=Oryza meridionalis TaxID=40149 RepID=A0A0E0DNE2_9ORYZ
MAVMETVEKIISTGINIHGATKLEDDLTCLRASLPNSRLVINRGEWGRFKNKDLAFLLTQLKDITYDTEDLLRKFDDQVLRQKIEDTDRSRAGQFFSSSLYRAKILICGSKTRIKDAQDKLDKAVDDLERALKPLGLKMEKVPHMPETSSVIGVTRVFGRDKERDLVIEKLGVCSMIGCDNEQDQMIESPHVPLTRIGGAARAKGKRAAVGTVATSASRAKQLKGESIRARPRLAQAKFISNVSVLPIVSIGGVGKTTLAQFIYNDPRVEAHFSKRIWVCVSDLFNKTRITKEIIESITRKEYKSSNSLDALQCLMMWPNANDEWETFFAPLRYGFEGSMILVTTRSPDVANLVASNNCNPFRIEGLDRDIFWEFFKKCAFGKQCPESYPQLHDIGRSIASRLCGSPLAAKTVGRLLNTELTVQHWKTVQNKELWELPHRDNDILPALQLSYLHLPQELKSCFAFCSMFPKGYSFERDEIVGMWVAQGFVAPEGSMRLEDTGIRYLDDLRGRFLLQTDTNCLDQSRYVMHDLIHDMAQSISVDKCFLMQDLSYQNQRRMPHAVRHMSVEVDSESLSQTRDIQYLNKLHSLKFGNIFMFEITWFNQLSNILFLSLKGCMLVRLPDSIGELHSLRYLNISRSHVQELPEKFWCLYCLQVLDASSSSLEVISPDVTKLINLRRLALPMGCSPKLSEISGLGNISLLRNLIHFTVGTGNGRKVGELKGMNQLSGMLTISSIYNVKSKEEAAEARLIDKQYLQALVLQWRDQPVPRVMNDDNGVAEELRFTSLGVEVLTIFVGSTGGGRMLQQASSSIRRSNTISCLTSICLDNCDMLRNLDQFLSPEHLPSIKSIEIRLCRSLQSIPVGSFAEFYHLQDLKISWCDNLVCEQAMVLPSSLRRLYINKCGGLDKSFPACLQNLTHLIALNLEYCNMESIPIGRNLQLKYLFLFGCSELSSMEGLHALSSMKYVYISQCTKLQQVEQPFKSDMLTMEEKEEHHKFFEFV